MSKVNMRHVVTIGFGACGSSVLYDMLVEQLTGTEFEWMIHK